MGYVTNGDIEARVGAARYVQLTDDAGSGSANLTVVAEARDGAEGLVNSHLAQRYAVPIDLAAHAEAAAVLKSVTLDLVEYGLHARRREVPRDVIVKRDNAVAWLQRVARGEAALPSLTEIEPSAASGPRAQVTGESRTLSRDELAEF
ncbi:MAG: DUF1320 domain-containing protein [Phycisphaerales bacterium]|nr:DUF1320 domain-containing protein [Phycisphaerales bacterium]